MKYKQGFTLFSVALYVPQEKQPFTVYPFRRRTMSAISVYVISARTGKAVFAQLRGETANVADFTANTATLPVLTLSKSGNKVMAMSVVPVIKFVLTVHGTARSCTDRTRKRSCMVSVE